MKFKTVFALILAFFTASLAAQAQAKLNVVATTEDLAAIAREVGGDRIVVESIARGYQDPHFVEAKPSFILKLQKADLLILVGRDLRLAVAPRFSRVVIPRYRLAQRLPDASSQVRIWKCHGANHELKVTCTHWQSALLVGI